MANATVRRSRQYVDTEVQGDLVRKIAIHWVLFIVGNSIALTIWMRLFEQPEASWGETLSDTFRRFLPFFIISLALVPAFVWDTLKLSNRFAGPISRLRNALKDLSRGQTVKPLHFRGSDYWQEIAVDFNQVAQRCSGASEKSEQRDEESGE